MEFRKMVTITLYARQKKRHRCIEQTFRLYGRRRGWDDLREQHQKHTLLTFQRWLSIQVQKPVSKACKRKTLSIIENLKIKCSERNKGKHVSPKQEA